MCETLQEEEEEKKKKKKWKDAGDGCLLLWVCVEAEYLLTLAMEKVAIVHQKEACLQC